jgi:phenylpropionate dioxygenase-like ring-hydroxylating dioxygenase large terminal subunit
MKLVTVTNFGVGLVRQAPWNKPVADPAQDEYFPQYVQPLVALFEGRGGGFFVEGRCPQVGPANLITHGRGNSADLTFIRGCSRPTRAPAMFELRIRAYKGRWQQAVLDYYGAKGEQPKQGAVWLTYFPNIMVEWYPHVLVVSTLIPQDVQKTLNVVEFYYPEDIALFEPEFIKAEQAAYMETAIEDDDIGERMDRGRWALLKQGKNEVGPYQSPMEDGMQHFHEFYRRLMSEALAGK